MKLKTKTALWKVFSKGGASSAGYHFYDSYSQCPRYFYIRQLLGIQTFKISRYLTFGKILHDCMELFYKTYPPVNVYAYATYALEQSADKYTDPFAYKDDQKRLIPMLKTWYKERYPTDLMEYDVVEIEKTHLLKLPMGYKMTGRLDRLFKHKETGKLVIVDTKSTSSNVNTPWIAGTQSDQFWIYAAMIIQDYDLDYIPEIYIDSIMGKINKSDVVCDTARLGPILPQPYELKQVLRMYAGLINEVSWKVEQFTRVHKPVDDEYLWPRRTTRCASFKGCEYLEICRKNLTKQRIGTNFFIDQPKHLIEEINNNTVIMNKQPKTKKREDL